MFKWWRVRSVDSNMPSAIDEASLFAKYRLDPGTVPDHEDPLSIGVTSAA